MGFVEVFIRRTVISEKLSSLQNLSSSDSFRKKTWLQQTKVGWWVFTEEMIGNSSSYSRINIFHQKLLVLIAEATVQRRSMEISEHH